MDRATLWELLGVQPDQASILGNPPDPVLRIAGRDVPCTLIVPDNPRATIIYAHAHGHRFDMGGREILDGRPSLQDPPLGLALSKLGYAIIAPDMPGHGRRQHEGTETALSKAAHWHGETLFGHMLRDLCAVVDAVPALGLPAPVGCVGFSMGALLSMWLAALRKDIVACAHLCGVTSMRALIDAGAHDLHAPYLTIPGLLRATDLPDIAAMIAPRPQFFGAGSQDPLTPMSTLEPTLNRLEAAYLGDGFTRCITPSGHQETERMRHELTQFFERYL